MTHKLQSVGFIQLDGGDMEWQCNFFVLKSKERGTRVSADFNFGHSFLETFNLDIKRITEFIFL